MVPPQHYPPAFPPEYSSLPMMMAVEQEQHAEGHPRPGRLAKGSNIRSQQHHPQPLPIPPPPPREEDHDPAPSLSASDPSISPLSTADDQIISLPENSIPLQGLAQQTTQDMPQQSNQSLRPQRLRKTTSSDYSSDAASLDKLDIDKSASSSQLHSDDQHTNNGTTPETTASSITTANATAQLPYTHAGNDAFHTEPHQQLQRSSSAGVKPHMSLSRKRSNPDARAEMDDSCREQELESSNDVNLTSKGANDQREVYDSGADQSPPVAAPNGNAPEGDCSVKNDPMGAGLKRQRIALDSVSCQSNPTFKGKDAAVAPSKKKAKAESTKNGANDTVSLFQKIFADRDPGKRKIKTKSVHEIPIDTGADEDDSDFDDNKANSNDEDEDMIMPEDAVSEDEIKPDHQDVFNDEQGLMTALWQWKDNDPEVCCVCLGRSTEADNVFVYCDTLDCALCVHQACYGVKILPSESEPWLCDRCKAPPEEVVSCVCCPSKDGAFRRLIPDDPSGGWVHVVCALWLPETTLGDPDNVDLISVRDIPERNWTLACYLCNDARDAGLGACVQCDAGQCRKSFHITCAQAYSLLETIEDSDMADPYFMYCKQHGSTDGQAKLNGWAKWVKQRNAFLKKWQEDQGRKRTQRLIDIQQSGYGDEEGGEGLVEFFEHSYSRFKYAREQKIARERSELSRQYSIGYYLGNKIDKSRSRLEVISSKARQALQEQMRIEMHTRNLLSSLLECANYLENLPAEQLEAPLSIDTTLAWYNSLPDTSRWKSNIQDIIETIDIDSLACDNPYTQPGAHGLADLSLEDSEGGHRNGRSSKGIYGNLSKKGDKASTGAGKNVKSKKVHPKPLVASRTQGPVVFTSSRGRLIKRDVSDPDEYLTSVSPGMDYNRYSSSPISTVKIQKPIMPCTVCHQLTLPEDKLALERDVNGFLAPMTIKALNRMVACATCQRQFHPKCLDPPMARVPPRWNCEDCDSSGESHGSSGETSPALAAHSHHHSHSSDLDEALMVLADTAVTVSAYSPRSPDTTTTQGVKRSHASAGSDSLVDRRPSMTDTGTSPSTAERRPKKIKTEGSEKPVAADKGRKASKANKNPMTEAKDVNGSRQPVAVKPSHIAPIVRGNLRIYPPGPHIAPKVSSVLMKEIMSKDTQDESESESESESETESPKPKVKAKAAPKKVKVSPPATVAKKDAATTTTKKKAKLDISAKVTTPSKTKRPEQATESSKCKVKATKVFREVAVAISKTTKGAKSSKTAGSTKEKASVRQGVLPAVPEPPPPKPKEVIRYTVGEKTVEELTAREDVEIERRENVKFRKLRGRTLTMPAPPQDYLDNTVVPKTGAVATAIEGVIDTAKANV
ncbi:PHD finger protein 14 [Mortierella polycephala]|uniref:PHD finger protein 14 n=1 Tax=Mortierella polycephala TaxID=41804 RepID=A0A9P6Q1S3_9FUNG|nr:PHD finger protein 14 [Mortierella polycephala]